MDYRTLTDTSSIQYQMQQEAYTDEEGFRRHKDGSYMVALGTYYADGCCGKSYKIFFNSGSSIECVSGDIKADEHTDETNRFREVNSELGCIVEFIVDTDLISDDIKISGDCSSRFPGQIVAIVEVEE